MTSVSRKEGFRYGFYVFAYWLVLLAFSAGLVAAGGWIVNEQVGDIGVNRAGGLAALGGFVAVLGVLVYGSGQVGLVYKVIADGVGAGSGPVTRHPAGPPAEPESAPTGDGSSADDGRESAGGPERASAPGAAAGGASREAEADRDGASPERRPTADDTPAESGDEGTGPDEPTPRPRDRPSQDASETEEATADGDRTSRTAGGSDPTGGQRRDPSVPGPGGDDERASDHTDATGADPTVADREASAASDPAGDDGSAESPADVASESGLAEKLGFEQAEGAGSTGDDAAPATDGPVPEWTTGENHMSGDDEPER